MDRREDPYVEFLRARWAEEEAYLYNSNGWIGEDDRLRLDVIEAHRKIVAYHERWPVLVKSEPEIPNFTGDIPNFTFQIQQRVQWLTEREYVERFGEAPPTAEIIRLLAEPYRGHPDHPENRRLG